MSLLNFKILILFCLLLKTLSVFGQEVPDTPQTFYDKRVDRYTSLWNVLIPRYSKIQFAGSMGMFSFGGGWNYGKTHWETDLLFGFVPKQTTNVHDDLSLRELKTMPTITLKQNYIPWSIPLSENIIFEPLTCGLYFNTLLNGKFWTKQPAKYPDGYYFFSTRIRTLICAGERITFKLNHKYKHNKSITLFYEVSSCDIYMLCAVQNKVLKPKDYLSLSLGVKLQIL